MNESSAESIAADLEACQLAGGVVVLDSGNYEAYRKDDKSWAPEGLWAAIARTPHDFAFCFDELNPPPDVDGVVRGVLAAVERDSTHSSRPILPIVHAPRDAKGLARPDDLPEIMRRVARELRPEIIAVPERELGGGLLARVRAVYEIRRRLDDLGFYQPLHLLGTGNPLTIAVLAAAGADCFDGLEWCRTVADHKTGRLFHFQHYEFFAWQSEIAASAVVREAVTSDRVEFPGKVVFHNLEFLQAWMNDVREMIRSGKFDRFLSDKLPDGASSLKQLEKAVPEVFG